MRCKRACLIINSHGAQNLVKLNDILAVLFAAGWKTDVLLKEYGGHSMKLAESAAAAGDYDMVIAYGGDGTLNQVMNGVMSARKRRPVLGVLPGGTVNEWAGEIGFPLGDPVKAALALVESEVRHVDVGHVEVESLTFLDEEPLKEQAEKEREMEEADEKQTALPIPVPPFSGHTERQQKPEGSAKAKHHFLLTAGLGIDAAIMGHVSKPLKYRVGRLAVGIAAAKQLPEQHPFPVEIRTVDTKGGESLLWRGQALQIVVGNTRRYAGFVDMTPEAYIDDGILDICVITAGSPLSTLQQIMSLMLFRKPDNVSAEFFQGAHFVVSVPASIDLQLDGSAMKLKDYLDKPTRRRLEQVENAEMVLVNYRFDALARALPAAIPRSYDETLFEKHEHNAEQQDGRGQQQEEEYIQQKREELTQRTEREQAEEPGQSGLPEQFSNLLEQGREVRVVGVASNVLKKHAGYIIAGLTQKRSTGELRPVAVRVDEQTQVLDREGRQLKIAAVAALPDNALIVVDGRKSKRGVISAVHVVI